MVSDPKCETSRHEIVYLLGIIFGRVRARARLVQVASLIGGSVKSNKFITRPGTPL